MDTNAILSREEGVYPTFFLVLYFFTPIKSLIFKLTLFDLPLFSLLFLSSILPLIHTIFLELALLQANIREQVYECLDHSSIIVCHRAYTLQDIISLFNLFPSNIDTD